MDQAIAPQLRHSCCQVQHTEQIGLPPSTLTRKSRGVCGRPYLKNNLGEVLIKFHSTSKRIPDAPKLVCPCLSPQILQFGVKCHCIQQVSWFSRPITVAQTAPTQATCIALELANLHTKGERERSHDVSGGILDIGVHQSFPMGEKGMGQNLPQSEYQGTDP